jgi:polyhydroxyalkanoate synthase subunit PhaC
VIDRRLAPRPLPAHLASATVLWLSSRAALTNWPSGSTRWNAPDADRASHLAALGEEVARLGPDRVAAALDREIARRAEGFAAGLDAYRRHPFRRSDAGVPVLWREGSARLLDFGGGGPAVLLVPSLINRYYILDLLPQRSFVRHLAAAGLRPLVLDWGEPGETECGFILDDYIAGPLCAALSAAVAAAGGPVALVGYCMGGLLALAAAQLRPDDVGALALLATPWDFHAERAAQARLLASIVASLPLFLGSRDAVPVSVIQCLFMALDPFLAERKFVRFAALDPQSDAAIGFVALEDWINDGVKLARAVALECATSWYRDNTPARGGWRVAGRAIAPQQLAVPALVVVPSRDRIVPPGSAAPLAAAIPNAAVLRPPFGHIGMMASKEAPAVVWQPIAKWLLARPHERPG